jgi:glycosyltransferase involved in cell wall biosynthesis
VNVNIAILGIKSIPAIAGADRVVEKLLEHFSSQNRYWIYVRADTMPVKHIRENVQLVRIPGPTGKHVGAFVYFLLCSVHCLLGTRKRYDLIHVHNSDFGLFLILLRLKGVPILGTFHGDPYTRQKWGRFAKLFLKGSERMFVQFADRLTSVSKFKSTSRGVRGSKTIEYVPNGVEPYVPEQLASHASLLPLIDGESYILFACGRLDSTKGLHHLLNAFGQVETDNKLLIIGDFGHDPPYSQAINQRIAADPRVVAHRSLLGRDVLLRVVSGCRVFVFPSEYEAMSMMLLEAVSCKAPVICSDILPNLEVVGTDYPYAYPTLDEAALASKIVEALREDDWSAITARLYERCIRNFGWPEVAISYERIYRDMRDRP